MTTMREMAEAEPGRVRKSGPGAPPTTTNRWGGQGRVAWKSRPPVLPDPGPRPQSGPWFKMKFIPPLAMFNDATQWVQLLFFVRPMPAGQNPDSNPRMAPQYFTPPPIAVAGLAAGMANVQLQLGQMTNQAARLTGNASIYYGT